MDFEFFQNLSPEQAKDFLSDLLVAGARRFPKFAEDRSYDGIQCDFSVESIVPVISSLLPKIVRIPLEPDTELPVWIRNSDSYRDDLFDFDSASKELIVTTSYYLGECFVRSFPKLRWATGKHGMAQMNMPVVTGFTHEMEMAVMLISETMFAGLLTDPGKKGDIDIAVKYWTELVPTSAADLPQKRK